MENKLPGREELIDYTPSKGEPGYVGPLFKNALNAWELQGSTMPLTTLREFTMLQLMNTITDKPDWNIKVNDQEITDKWKQEAMSSGADITSAMVDYCIDELRYKASLIPKDASPPIIVYNGDVVKSDTALSVEFKKELQEAVTKFENSIPARLKDWHPGSDEKVWDLVHPSLFPLVYGRSRVLERGMPQTTLDDCIERCGEGKIADVRDSDEGDRSYSQKFQWLPCEVDISGEDPKITTYINNLHPQREKPLYALVEKLIKESIPLWDLTLAPLRNDFCHQLRIKYHHVEHADEGETDPNIVGPLNVTQGAGAGSSLPQNQSDDGEDDDEDDDHDEEDDFDEFREARGPEIRPQPGVFAPLPAPPKFSLKDAYKQRGLQVIVKLANIELTPEKPDYAGGSWHVEGQLNEHIVATALYYYSCSNITSSSLSFRQMFSVWDDMDEVNYEQDDHRWVTTIFGCKQDGLAIQDVGGVDTREGRLLTFPNVLQHRVGPFKLQDPTKPGHRKIVALFLVDPNIKIISTAHVPCQRQDWWVDNIQQKSNAAGLDQLPLELQENVLEGVDFPISLREAKQMREELMEERKLYHLGKEEKFKEDFTISLCEH
ncbi:hypothetical protein JR316_0008896 [Psilocybe cubensis]|uniref:Uncharacterized protein n=2 Tax=Psilocybe cubensis TaxID=181762 RepID=A0ACB8GS88_PSICU|nr:hypothetical protein JR316_0008896 [Psilocybe cubensis]KAH9478441.1 hypothetical protein JR316_0008896 [Psilocybe cubensis]